MPSSAEIAWAAGFFDGEGCTCLSKTRGHANPKLTVAQKDLRPLRRFHKIVGRGNIGQPHGKAGVSHWYAGAWNDVIHILDLLWPHLSEPKREQATRILDQRTHVKRRRDSVTGQILKGSDAKT